MVCSIIREGRDSQIQSPYLVRNTGAGNRSIPALSSPRRPLGTGVPVTTSAKLHRLCHVLGVERESRTCCISVLGLRGGPLRQRCSDEGWGGLTVSTTGDGYEGSLKVPIEESTSKRRSERTELTRKIATTPPLQNDRKSTRERRIRKADSIFFGTT